MYVGITVVALMGVVFSMIIKGLGRLVMPWSTDGRRMRRRRSRASHAAITTLEELA
jgi:hypothetical protein